MTSRAKLNLYRYYVERVLFSLTHVHAVPRKYDPLYKLFTLRNIIEIIAYRATSSKLTRWSFKDVVIKVKISGIPVLFYIPQGLDYNVFLNPYLHEYEIVKMVTFLLESGDTFIDVGAHAGLYTCIASKIVEPEGIVVSIEPNPINVAFLQFNIKLNKLKNVLIIPKAAGDRAGRIRMYYSIQRTASTSAFKRFDKHEERTIDVDVVTLDEIVQNLGLKYVKLIKVDTEGADHLVLRGSLRTLSKTMFVIVEQNDRYIRELLQSVGFSLATLLPSHYLFGVNEKLCDPHVASYINTIRSLQLKMLRKLKCIKPRSISK